MPDVKRLNEKKKADFLQHIREGVPILKAAKNVGISHTRFYEERYRDKEYDEAWKVAVTHGDKIKLARYEEEADRRAIEGYEKPVYQGGDLVGTETRYSDNLMMFRMKALAPEKYKDRYEATLQASVTVNVVEMYREASSQADQLRLEAEQKRLNGKGNGHANGNGHARSG